MGQNYPIGIQTFSKLVEENGLYVDKTRFIMSLIESKIRPFYFLSRPRRFGKSLLISTLKSIFKGEKELFKDLYIYDKIEWETYPIIHISMDNIGFAEIGFFNGLENALKKIEQEENLQIQETNSLSIHFQGIIKGLYEKYGKKVVILIDEYDKPITHGLEFDTVELAIKNRDIMKNFYSCLKPMDEYIRFLFITGISKFTRVSIFSDLNHLTDISLDKRYATICGYTQQELEHYFMEGIELLAQENDLSLQECLIKVKDWYNGFSWDGKNFVYNPYSTLKLLDSSQFNNYWFETGTPTFLVKMLRDNWDYVIDNVRVRALDFDTFDLRDLDAQTILLQTGYLTIKKRLEDEFYLVSYPNKEVKQSFEEMLLGRYLNKRSGQMGINIYDIKQAFQMNDLELVMKIIETMFHSLPVELFDKKDKDGKVKEVGENFYHAVIYLIFNLLGVRMNAEVMVRDGRIDAVVETEKHVYLFEFKKDQSPEVAITQIENRYYAGKYALSNKTIHLIGVSFSLSKRGISREDWKSVILNQG